MKLLYIAGPIRAANGWLREQNIRRAEEAAFKLIKMGFAVHCPHALARFLGEALKEPDAWLPGDFEVIERADALVLTLHWDTSEGTMAEYTYALDKGKPVFNWPRQEEQLEWWRDDREFQCRNCSSKVEPWDITPCGLYEYNHRRFHGQPFGICGNVEEIKEGRIVPWPTRAQAE
jgi:nucleoside 2-deoxyribosyltransferase